MEKQIRRINPNNTGLYSNVTLGPISIRTPTKTELQLGWDNMYTQLQKTLLKKVKKPYAVFTSVGSIDFFDLESSVADTKTIQEMNKLGLDIYLYEPLSTYTPTSKNSLYVEYETGTVDVFSYELDSIQTYTKRNNLTNVRVYTPNYNVETYFQKKYPELQLYCTPIGWVYPATLGITLDEPSSDTIQKTFWCGNWRYTGTRHLIASYLTDCYSNKTNLSWIYQSNQKILEQHLWFDLDKLTTHKQSLINGANKLGNRSPITMDISVDRALGIDEYVFIDMNTNPKKFYEESFCAIVNETRFAEPTQLLTEKIMYAMLNHRPFIIVGPPHSLKYMRNWGWKTFDNWFDESYDNEECHYRRLEKILKLIDHIGSMTLNDLRNMYSDMIPILKHNSNTILELQTKILGAPVTKNKLFEGIRHAN